MIMNLIVESILLAGTSAKPSTPGTATKDMTIDISHGAVLAYAASAAKVATAHHKSSGVAAAFSSKVASTKTSTTDASPGLTSNRLLSAAVTEASVKSGGKRTASVSPPNFDVHPRRAKSGSDVGNPNSRDSFTTKRMITSCRYAFLVLPLLIVAGVSSASFARAMSPNPNSYIEKNKDGSVTPPLFLRGNGENFGSEGLAEVTVEGYTVSQVFGNYEYMQFDPALGIMVSSGLVAGKDNPKKTKSKTNGKMLSLSEHETLWAKNKKLNKAGTHRSMIGHIEDINEIPNHQSHVARRRVAVLGVKKNLMVAFKFSDHQVRTVPTNNALTVLMNNVGPDSTVCPTGSVRDVYLKSSYGQLDLRSTVAPWVTLPNTEAYYANGNSGLGTRAHLMIRDALNALQATGFNFDEFDTDNDGYIDAIGFLHSGYGAEWGGTDAYGTSYTNRIWSHKWALYSLPGGQWTSTSGKKVYNYHISPSVWGTSGSNIGRIGVIAHETGHFFGLPDLYDGSGGQGIGSWCLMANSWGFDGSQFYPPSMSAWSKLQLGWVIPQEIMTSGSYTARQGCNFQDIFIIKNNFQAGEYLLIENRQRCGFDAIIPGPGLAIFHIDDSASYTSEGYPGLSTWPTNHYRVALLQADGLQRRTRLNVFVPLDQFARDVYLANAASTGSARGGRERGGRNKLGKKKKKKKWRTSPPRPKFHGNAWVVNINELCSNIAVSVNTKVYAAVHAFAAFNGLTFQCTTTSSPKRYTVPITNLALNQGVANHYYMDVTAGQTVSCSTNGPNGDADLYMRFGEPALLDPSFTGNVCAGYTATSNELCSNIAVSVNTKVYAAVHAFAAFNGLTFQCTTTPSTARPTLRPSTRKPTRKPSSRPTTAKPII
ncbi:hypothetical protein ACHAXA_006810 [Cyclostephanos tholiformis]|uniref:Peptidase M6-like domain-containing protein n=1 Tax=Cyclostephanos tholiformis TaxID=382380 RepID=A0ABD3RR06_9STRA